MKTKLYAVKLTQLELVMVENLIFQRTMNDDKMSKCDINILNDVAIRMNKVRHGEID